MQTNQLTADQFISNDHPTTAASENNAATTTKSYTGNLVTGKTKVPLPIHIICILGAGGLGLAGVGLLLTWQTIAALSTVVLAYSIIALGANLLSIIWMWKMKKWGAYLFATVFLVGQIILISFGVWAFNTVFIINLASTVVALFYSKQMN